MFRELLERTLFLIPLWISLGVHEWAHASAAHALGDDTAETLGRRSLNPLAHLDPIGTVLLPLLGVPFGWAKPVPVEPTRFRSAISMRGGLLLVAGAGPLSNAVLALLLLVADVALWRIDPGWLSREPRLARIFGFALSANVALAVLNLLPLAPLDGSRIVEGLVPFERRALWDRLERPVGIAALVAFLFFGAPWLLETVERLRAALRGAEIAAP